MDDESAVRLRLAFLGGFHASLDEGRTLGVPGQKARALLAFLALPAGRAHTRGALSALLWPESTAEHARTSLRQTLRVLRRALEDHPSLRLDADLVALDPAWVEVDVAVFERLAADREPSALAEAAALYGGDLLLGLDPRAPAFEEWLVPERERLRELAIEVLARLLARQRTAGALDAAIQTATRLVAIDPLQEAVHRTLMRLYAQQGRRAAALRQYQTCVAMLDRELGIAPEVETRRLYREIVRQRKTGTGRSHESLRGVRSSPGAGPVEALQDPSPFIGREEELARLRGVLGTGAVRGAAVMVVGEAGIGKSRLLGEAAAEATAAGARVILARCHVTERSLALAPWAECARALLAESPGLADELPRVWRDAVARLLPELSVDAPIPSGPGDEGRFFEGVARLFTRAAQDSPLVVILDDLQWADEVSMRLFAFVGRRTASHPMVLLGALRAEEIDDAPGLGELLYDLGRDPCGVVIELHGLARDETLTLARLHARRQDIPIDELFRVSEGNPFIVVESARALRDGHVRPDAGVPLPERVRELVLRRLAKVEPGAQELAGLAAVIGADFDFGLLIAASGRPESAVTEDVEALVTHGILRSVGERLDVAHEWIRAVVMETLSPSRRPALHRAVAAALEAGAAGDLDALSSRIAFHHARGGDQARAIAFLARAAAMSRRTHAFVEAAANLEAALRHAATLPPPGRDGRRVELLLELTSSLYPLGRFAEAIERLSAEIGTVDALGDSGLSARFYFVLARISALTGRTAAARAHAQRSLADAERAGDEATAGKALHVLAHLEFFSGQPVQGAAFALDAANHFARTKERWWEGQTQWILSLNQFVLGDLHAALASARTAGAIAELLGDIRLECYAECTVAALLAAQGEFEGLVQRCERARAQAPDRVTVANANTALGYVHVERGAFEEAIPVLDTAVRQLAEFGAAPSLSLFTGYLAEAHRQRGDLERAEALAAEAAEVARRVHYVWAVGYAERTLGRIARDRSDTSEAGRRLEQALAAYMSIASRFEKARTHLDLAELCRTSGNIHAARRHAVDAHAVFTALALSRHEARARAVITALTGGEPGGPGQPRRP